MIATPGSTGHELAPPRFCVRPEPLSSFRVEEAAEDGVELAALVVVELVAEVALDVSGVVGGHSSVQAPTVGGEADDHFPPVGYTGRPFEETVVDQPTDDPVAGAVGHEQASGQLGHAERLAGDRQLVQHVVVVERAAEPLHEAGVHRRGRPAVEPNEQLPRGDVLGAAHGPTVAEVFPNGNILARWLVSICMTTTPSSLDIRRAGDRFHTAIGWLDSKHSFSFGHHRDARNTNHGQLLVLNDDRVAGGTGFDTHPHRDMEIVTWVLDGELEHKDSEGNRVIIYPGLAQRMTAGTGIWHSEKNASATDDVHFIQMWVLPDTEGVAPGYQQLDINEQLDAGGLVPIASGQGHDAAISIQQRDAVLWGGRLRPAEVAQVPSGPFAHVFVARGSLDLEPDASLDTGDAARLTGATERTITAGPAGAEVLIWITGPTS